MLTGSWDENVLNSRQNRSENKLSSENAVTQVHGSRLLRVMISWDKLINNETIIMTL